MKVRVGSFLNFVGLLSSRTTHPHVAYAQMSKRNRTDQNPRLLNMRIHGRYVNVRPIGNMSGELGFLPLPPFVKDLPPNLLEP